MARSPKKADADEPVPLEGISALASELADLGAITWDGELNPDDGGARTFRGREGIRRITPRYLEAVPEAARDEVRRAARQALRNGEYAVRYQVTDETGAPRWLEDRGHISESGSHPRFSGVLRDVTSEVTAVRRSLDAEALLAAVVENTAAAVFVKDTQGAYRMVNVTCERLWGRPRSEIIGKTDHDLLPKATADELAKLDRRVLEQAKPQQTEERIAFPTGERVFLSLKVPLFAADDSVWALCGIATDITERKQAELELERRGKDLERLASELSGANRRQREVLAMLAHELRNPLAAVRAAIDLLSADQPPRRELEILDRNANQLGKLVDELLETATVAFGQVELESSELDLWKVVQAGVERVRRQLSQRDNQLHTTCLAPLTVRGDRGRLEQVFAQLVGNASRYSHPGSRIWITAERRDDDAIVSIHDEGVGVAPELLPHVFEPFTQASQRLDRPHGGLGLGLALVSGIVQLQGGHASAASDGPGKGSTFTVTLPIAKDAPNKLGDDATTATGDALDVLIVDDNQDFSEMLAETLSRYGCRARIALDGETALMHAGRQPPELVLLDIGLPKLDGFEVARRMRNQAGAPLIAAVTGYGSAADRACSRAAGMDAHLVKPVQLNDVFNLLAEARRRRAHPGRQRGAASDART